MTSAEIVALAIRNVLTDIKNKPWDTPIEQVLKMLADEIQLVEVAEFAKQEDVRRQLEHIRLED